MNHDRSQEAQRFDGSFDGTRERQYLLGLSMSPEERLRWLEMRMTELRAMLGKASSPQRPKTR